MKRIIQLMIACIFALSAGASTPGVSRQLAAMRSAAYSHITYDLYFDLRNHATTNGVVDISFTHPAATDAIIDFRADREQILGVKVNGKTISNYRAEQEHIIIPGEQLPGPSDRIAIQFIAGEKPLNRNTDFLYTLLVPDRARTLFPCFDQPDLKATYRLTLDVPRGWVALSNTSVIARNDTADFSRISFADTEPLSTYLFSFVAGKFSREERTHQGRTIAAYYRETDPQRIAQLDTIFAQVFHALQWQEEHTGVKYPFAKYDFVILPGFQFGGMEHTGATLYNDRSMFLGPHPTPSEELKRAQLIAHETSHMWFGDLVTMRWFDDVWTKEVFANYYAAVITEPTFPDLNHTLSRICSFYVPALNQDFTLGATAIQQPLDNLQDAGLIYNNIIYNKAPVVMFKIVDLMGKEAFSRGIRNYVGRFAYGNATWDDLIACLNAETDVDLEQFSNVWIKSKGMPEIAVAPCADGFDVTQTDPYGRGLLWPQRFSVMAVGEDGAGATVEVDLQSATTHCPLPFRPKALVVNADGRGYGLFLPDDASLAYLCDNLGELSDEVTRLASVITIYENYLRGRIAPAEAAATLLAALGRESNPLIASQMIGNLEFVCTHTDAAESRDIELRLSDMADTLAQPSARLQLQRKLCAMMREDETIEKIYEIWSTNSSELWSESDYTTAAYELAIRRPQLSDSILRAQRLRITNPDRLRQFDFVSRACTADTASLDSLFDELHNPANRRVEPYAEALLRYLNHPLRDVRSARYVIPALEMLPEIQRTGDIFFPAKWAQALLSGHRSTEARAALNRYLTEHPECPTLLRNKILEAAFPLLWAPVVTPRRR
jgi:aminopeptidase N